VHKNRQNSEGDQWYQRQQQIFQQVVQRHVGVAAAFEEVAEDARDRVHVALRLHGLRRCGECYAALLGRQGRRGVGAQLGDDHHVEDVEARQHQAGKERARVQLHHRDAGGGTVDDQHHRGRNQNAQAAAGGNRARGHAHVVAGFEHDGHGE